MDGPVAWILGAAAAASAGCVLASLVHAAEPGRGHHRRAERLMGASAALLVAATAWSANRGGPGGESLLDPGVPAWLVPAASLWVTPQGSLMAVASIASAALWWTARRWRKGRLAASEPDVDAMHPAAWMLGLGSLLCLALLAALLRLDDPSPTRTAMTAPAPLLVLLAAPLNLAARGFTIPIAAAAAAYLGTGRREWAALALPWARWAFVAAWSSLALTGAAGRQQDGTFWTWSPGETSAFLVVLAFIVALHALIYHRKRGTFRMVAPLAAFAALLLPWLPRAPARGWALPGWTGAETTSAAAVGLAAWAAWAAVRALRSGRRGPDGKTWTAPWSERLNLQNMVYLAMVLTSMAGAALLVSDVADPAVDKRSMLDDGAVALSVPFLTLLGFGLGSKTLGFPRALAAAGLAVAAGGALAFADPPNWRVLLPLPVAVFALVGASIKLFKVADPGSSTPMDLRMAGGMLLAGAVAAIVWWASPGLSSMLPPPGAPAGGIALGFAGLAGVVSCLRRDHWLLALSGPFALLLSLAPPAMLLGVLALAVVARRGPLFAHGAKGWDLAGLRGRLERDLRKTGVYIVHVGIVLGMAGYAAVHFAGAPIGAQNLAWGGSMMVAGGALLAVLLGGARFELGGAKKD